MINRNYWQESFKKGEFPHWNCPACKKSFLTFVPNGIKEFETAESLERRNDFDWSETEIKETFIGILKCNNVKCEQIYTITGDACMDVVCEENEISENTEYKYFRKYYPVNINPPLHIFELPFDTPIDVEIEILTAFKLFWTDKPSCGNQIRKVVEAIMDDKRVQKTKLANRKEKLSLHQRINKFKEKNEDIAETLLAIKWIGNSGSHLGNFDTEEILDGLELLDEAINNLYNRDKNRTKEIRKRVLKKHEKK